MIIIIYNKQVVRIKLFSKFLFFFSDCYRKTSGLLNWLLILNNSKSSPPIFVNGGCVDIVPCIFLSESMGRMQFKESTAM